MPTITFHTFHMGDVDDVDIFVAQPIWEWQQSEHGQWVMTHAQDLRYYTGADPHSFGYQVNIRGTLEPHLATEYFLRWSNS